MEPFVGIRQVAAFLGMKVSYIYEKCRLGAIPSVKIGGLRRFKLSEVDRWARGGRDGAEPTP